jgi:hypothetical protein
MRTIQSGALAATLVLGLGGLPIQAEDTAAVNEVLRLKNAGVAEETIVTFIRSQNKITLTIAARTVGGGQARRPETIPANKK